MSKGNRYGMFIGLSTIIVYIYAFFAVGIFFIWQAELPVDGWGWAKLVASSAAYVIGGIAVFIPVFIFALVMFLRDRKIAFIGVPILVTIVYALLPIPLPGPLDEAIIFALAYWIRVRTMNYFAEREQTRLRDEPAKMSAPREREVEVIDVEPEEK